MGSNRQLIEKMLILRCQMGDNEAFAELIEHYGRSLYYFISRLLDSREITEDIYQDTWLTVIKKIHSLNETDSFTAWLYHIARNKIYHHLRKKKLIHELHENIVIENYEDNGEFFVEDAAEIHKALEKLHPAHKEVLMLRFLEQMSYEQIAHVINCNMGTVKSRIYYAKNALKKEMEK